MSERTDEVTGEIMSVENKMALVEKAKLDGAIATAKAYPRNMQACLKECEDLITADLNIAEKAYYYLPPRKNKKGGMSDPIVGPSIRIAELFASTVGNLAIGVGFAEVDKAEQRVNVRAFIHDLEKNVRIEEEYSTRILWAGADAEKNALDRARAYAVRNATTRMFGIHIRTLAEKAMDYVAKTSDVEGARDKTLKAFKDIDVTEEELLAWCKLEKTEDIDAGMISRLRGAYQAITNNYTTVDAQFRPDKAEEPIEADVDLGDVTVEDPPPPRDEKPSTEQEDAFAAQAEAEEQALANPTTEPDETPTKKGSKKKGGTEDKQGEMV